MYNFLELIHLQKDALGKFLTMQGESTQQMATLKRPDSSRSSTEMSPTTRPISSPDPVWEETDGQEIPRLVWIELLPTCPPEGETQVESLAHWANFADRESFHRSLWTPSQPTRGRHRRKIIGSESVRYFWFPRPSWLGRPPAGGYEFRSNTQTFPRLWGMSNKCTPWVSPWCKIWAFLYSFLFSRLWPKRGN